MPYRYALAEHGKTLATRPLGHQLRTSLVQEADGAISVALDFSGVISTSHSFADEFVARLAEEIKLGEVPFGISISGATPEVERVVLKALERRQLEAPLLV
ncbi:MAG TPA: DUF4325 domain-containing protein [Solirubrobacterales bacterium]|nr:DUF4325 domain-containing protein [Solirubrobacterales bacterium]